MNRTHNHKRMSRSAYSLASVFLAALLAVLAVSIVGPRQGATDASGVRYIGVNKCKNCHSADKTGNQYAAWKEMKHAKAYTNLASDKAKEDGKKLGVANPQQSPKCLKCHVTAYGKPAARLAKGFDPKLSVQCESCHGPGEAHFKARFAAASEDEGDDEGFGFGEEEEEYEYTPVPKGEIILPGPDTCRECHNEDSPEFKDFCFRERLAKIQHFNPQRERTKKIKQALEKKGSCDIIPELKLK